MAEQLTEKKIYTWKERLAVKKGDFGVNTPEEITQKFQTAEPTDLERGNIGLWVSPYVKGVNSVTFLWPILDVESPGGKSVSNSIAVAQEFYYKLTEHILIHSTMKILLTGNGFRFVMPFLLDESKIKAFAHWISTLDGKLLDAKPSTKDLPIRMHMYRSKVQEGTKKDLGRHVHQLDDHADLFSLTPERYLELVSGWADHHQMVSWISSIWPTEECPMSWTAFLGDVERSRRFKSTIINVPGPVSKVTRSYGVNWPMIDAYLRELGQSPMDAHVGETKIVKLQECPVCGRRDGNPWIWPSGVLACFRGSCDANHHSGGLPPWKWVPDYRGIEPDEAEESLNTVTVNEARDRISKAVQGDKDLILAVTPGAGKTTTTLSALAPQLKDKLCLWACPTKELGREAETLARSVGGFDVAFIEGRTSENCKHFVMVQDALIKGLSPALKVCAECSSKRGVYQCGYYKQMDELPGKGLIVTSHAKSLYLEHAITPDIFVLDEDCLGTFFQKDRVSLGDMDSFISRIQTAHSGFAQGWEKMERVRREIATKVKPGQYGRLYATDVPEHTQRWESHSLKDLAGLTDEEIEIMAHAVAVYEPLHDETAFGWQQRLDREGIDPRCINWFQAFFGESRATAYISIRTERGKGSEYVAYHKARPFPVARLILIDGTANPDALRQMFKRDFEVVDAKVTIQGCKKVHLKRWLSKTAIKGWKNQEKELESALRPCIGHLESNAEMVLVYTHKFLLEEGVLPKIVRGIDPRRHYEFANYYASRGVNRFEDFDAVIAFGTPAMNGIEALDQGMEFFDEESEQDRWSEYLRKAELCQAVHRVRPIKGSKTIIVAANYWPQDLGKPDVHIVSDRKENTKKGRMHEALMRASEWVYEHGFFTKETAPFCGIIPQGKEEFWELLKNDSVNVPTHIRDFFNGMRHKTATFLQRKDDWGDLLDLLLLEFPKLPRLEMETEFTRGVPLSGIGAGTNLALFYASIGLPIDRATTKEAFKPEFSCWVCTPEGDEFEITMDSYHPDPVFKENNQRNLTGEFYP